MRVLALLIFAAIGIAAGGRALPPCAVPGAVCCETCSPGYYLVPGACGVCLTSDECRGIRGRPNTWHFTCMGAAPEFRGWGWGDAFGVADDDGDALELQ